MENEKTNKTFISERGYGLLKSEFDYKDINKVREELTVSPKTMNSFGTANITKYKIYTESSKKIYLPKYYGLKNFGKPDVYKLNEGKDINIKFNGELRENQLKPVEKFLESAKDPNKMGGLINLACAAGKCHGIDTPIIMYDGSIKKVQDIIVGDQLMGDDSTPRNVLSLARGSEMIYNVIPLKGDSYTVNESHILSLKSLKNFDKELSIGDKIDIPLKNYIKLSNKLPDKFTGYRVGIDFQFKEINFNFDPNLFGYLTSTTIGDFNFITSNSVSLNEKDLEYLHKNRNTIPDLYKCNSKEIRLNVLSGIIKGTSSDIINQSIENNIILKYLIKIENKKLLDDIIYLARSLEFAAFEKVFDKKTNKYQVEIYGDKIYEIPNLPDEKRIKIFTDNDNHLNTRIRLEKKQVDNYYGFTIDGNHRYLLGDFQVTHNTVMSLNIISQLGKKTLVVVHKDFLLKQWRERIEHFLPDARIGLVKAKVIDIEDKDIVMASLQSLAMKEYDKGTFDEFGLVVCDEVHNFAAEVFSRALFKINFKYSLGLSATITRKDGLSKVFKWHLGDIVYKNTKKKIDKVLVECHEYYNDSQSYSKEETLFNNKPNMARMINNICYFDNRTDYIVNIIKRIKNEENNRNILLLSDRREHLKDLKNKIDNLEINNSKNGYYVGGMKDNELKYTEDNCDIILATFSMAAEGLDLPKLDSVILCSPKSSIEQSVGRILRKKMEDRIYIPLIIDIIDYFSMFINQSKKRIKYYKKCNYDIKYIKSKKSIDNELNKIKLEGKCYIK
jgi:superfamily II DNA or RNA helicase